jgi:hypothetical protein
LIIVPKHAHIARRSNYLTAKVINKFIGLNPPLFLSPTNLITFAGTQNGQ